MPYLAFHGTMYPLTRSAQNTKHRVILPWMVGLTIAHFLANQFGLFSLHAGNDKLSDHGIGSPNSSVIVESNS